LPKGFFCCLVFEYVPFVGVACWGVCTCQCNILAYTCVVWTCGYWDYIAWSVLSYDDFQLIELIYLARVE
jgi:hypothetical protein